ncbi:MAG: hypothetical protein CL843_00575 [Crocinitomicaceae bacterium]|nr:hypothetical protein [Crocinitomicaceae bacterium]
MYLHELVFTKVELSYPQIFVYLHGVKAKAIVHIMPLLIPGHFSLQFANASFCKGQERNPENQEAIFLFI